MAEIHIDTQPYRSAAMNKITKYVLGGGLVLCVVAGVTLATPTVGVAFNNILSTGTIEKNIDTRAHVALPGTEEPGEDDEGWRAKVETDGASNVIVQDIALLPGGYTGWHTHPGILLLTLTEGSVEWFDAKCGKHIYNAGDSWTENTPLHDVRNAGSVNAHFVITYLIAKGQPKRIDQPAPACAAALGLP
jgi:quercetin dioxygenase-like cupin family protein